MSQVGGQVGADGASVVPGGLYDMAELGRQAMLDPKMEQQLQDLFESSQMAESQKLKATYKLELVIGPEGRSLTRPFSGLLMAWTNEGFQHGGGDEVVYFCPAKTERSGKQKTCGAALDLKWVGRKIVVCPSCRQTSKPLDLCGQIWAKLPIQHWATLVQRCFMALNFDADIRMVTMHGGGMHQAYDKEKAAYRKGDAFSAVRQNREWVIYPLANIMKDTAAGADLHPRIRSFLGA